MTIEKIDGTTTLYVDRDSSSGHFIGVSTTLADNTGLQDAFGRLRMSTPTALFVSQLTAHDSPLFWQEKITNNSASATSVYNPNESTKELTVGASDTIIRQSKQYQHYQPGKSQFTMATFVMSPSAIGLTQRIGYFDADDGIFLEQDAGQVNIVRRTSTSGSPVNNKAAQASWNIDPLDGTGKSGIVLDTTKSQIFLADMEWLGVGRARAGFVIDGKYYYAHQFLNANNLDTVYIKTAQLPVRYEISGNSALSGTKTLKAICATVVSEGGIPVEAGWPFSISNQESLTTVSNTKRAVLSIRPRLLTTGNTENREQSILTDFAVYSEDNPAYYEIIYGASLANASWINVSQNYSQMQYDETASAYSGGILIDAGYVAGQRAFGGGGNNQSLFRNIPLALDIDGNHPTSPLSDCLTLVAVRIGTTDTDVGGIISWVELQ